jgi:hypothetical protein
VNRLTRLILPLATLLIAGCAATTMQGTWTNPEHTGQVKSVFIIGVARTDFNRRLFEDEFNRQLRARGVKGISSYQHMELAEIDDRNATVAKVKSLGADSVVVTRVIGSRTDTVVNPGRTTVSGGSPYRPRGYRDHWHSYYRSSYQVISQPATVTDFQVYTIESNLFGTDKGMIWSAQSETIAGGQLEATIREFVELTIRELDRSGLI